MARSKSPDSIKAEELYRGGMSLVEIASQLNVSDGTVRSWKNRYKWDGDSNATLQKDNRNVAFNGKDKRKAVAEDVKQVMSNKELTDKQRLFCCIYVQRFNATKAYQKAYGVDYVTALSAGSRLLGNDRVKAEIQRLKQNKLNREMFNESDLFQRYMDIAYADITDYMEFGNEVTDVVDDNGKEYKVKVSRVNIKNDHEVDGTLISEVSKGKDGVKVKLPDKMRAMDWLSSHMDFATEEQRARIEQMRANTEKLLRETSPLEDEGVEIINDAPQKASEDIRHSNT